MLGCLGKDDKCSETLLGENVFVAYTEMQPIPKKTSKDVRFFFIEIKSIREFLAIINFHGLKPVRAVEVLLYSE